MTEKHASCTATSIILFNLMPFLGPSFLAVTTILLLLLLLPVQILEIKTESQDLIAALNTLSAAYPDNTPAARRHLRSTIEERGLAINEQFLAAAQGVTQVPRTCFP